jgi:hypothetical protein
MIFIIFFLNISLAHSSAVNIAHLSNDKDFQIFNLNLIFEATSDFCKTTNSLYKLYSIFKALKSCNQAEETCKLKMDIVKRFSELHANKILAETLKDLIIRNNFYYVYFYCWALVGPKDICSDQDFEDKLIGSIAIVKYFLTQIEDMYQERVPIDFHVMGLMLKIIEKFTWYGFKWSFVRFWKQSLKSPKLLINLLKKDPHAQFREIMGKYDLEGGMEKCNTIEGLNLAQEGLIALQYFSKSHFIRDGQIVDWDFVNSQSPRRLMALFYVYLEEVTGIQAVRFLLKILGSKIDEKSLEKFLEDFFRLYHHLLDRKDITKDEYENILGIGYRLRRLFKSSQIRNRFLFKQKNNCLLR